MGEILNPHDAEIEEAVIAACLIETEAMPMVADKVRPEMFYEERYAFVRRSL